MILLVAIESIPRPVGGRLACGRKILICPSLPQNINDALFASTCDAVLTVEISWELREVGLAGFSRRICASNEFNVEHLGFDFIWFGNAIK